MKVAIINRHRQDTMGGSELQCDFIATELIKRGYDVLYIAMLGTDKDYGCPYEVIPCKSEPDDIKMKLINFQPDIIYWRYNKRHFHTIAKFAYNKEFRFIFSASHIIDLKPWYFNKKTKLKYTIKTLIDRFWEHRGFKYIDALIVNNKEFLHILSVPNQTFIPNGMSAEYVPFTWNKPYVLWVANIKQSKRPELFVNLAKKFMFKEIDFLMVGAVQEGSYSWIQYKKNLPDNLYYLGPKTFEEVNGMMKESMFHVHTCTAEGFPNIFIQAWLQGIPSVTYGFDPSNYIVDNKIGYNAKEDWSTFVSQVSDLLNSKEKRDLYGSNAKTFSQELFQTQTAVDKLEELMESLIVQK